MKRALVLLLALAVTGALAGSAQAARSVSAKAVGKSPAEVAAYWTAARMKNAKPVERARSNGAGSRSCAATDSANDRSASAKRPSLCSRSPR